MTSEKLKKFNTEGMTHNQGIGFLKEIIKINPLGSGDELVFKETIKKLEELNRLSKQKIKKQEIVIDYSLEKLNKKDVVTVTRMLLK